MSYKIIAGLVIGGMLLAGCASLPEVSPETSEPPMTDAPDVVSEPTSTAEPKSIPEDTPSGDQPILVPGSGPSPLEPMEDEEKMVRGGVIIESSEVLVLESFPPQIHLRLTGNLPTPCHRLRADLGQPGEDKRIQVELYSLVDPNQVCAQVLQPFEATLDLGSYPQGEYEVLVNGEVVGSFTL